MRESEYPTARLTHPHWVTYGFGWFQQDYEGRRTDFHTGSIDGMVAIAGLIRDENLGVYVLANRDHAELRHALMYRVFDLFDADPPRDWSAELKTLYDGLAADAAKRQAEQDSALAASHVLHTKPSLPLDAYAGTYTDSLYGKVEVVRTPKGLRLIRGALSGDLEHWHYDTFRLHLDRSWYGTALVTFSLGPDATVQKVETGGMTFRRAEGGGR